MKRTIDGWECQTRGSRALAAALLLVACADAEALATAPCGWVHRADTVLGRGSCWRLEPAPGMAITEPGASACAAAQGQRRRIWPPGQPLWLWTRSWDSGYVETSPVRAECPP